MFQLDWLVGGTLTMYRLIILCDILPENVIVRKTSTSSVEWYLHNFSKSTLKWLIGYVPSIATRVHALYQSPSVVGAVIMRYIRVQIPCLSKRYSNSHVVQQRCAALHWSRCIKLTHFSIRISRCCWAERKSFPRTASICPTVHRASNPAIQGASRCCSVWSTWKAWKSCFCT